MSFMGEKCSKKKWWERHALRRRGVDPEGVNDRRDSSESVTDPWTCNRSLTLFVSLDVHLMCWWLSDRRL
jgi:hypothetical protein